MNARVHSKYKTKYRVTNWAEYERGLVQRGEITVWLSNDAIDTWCAQPTGKRGAQPKSSDLAIETALTLRLVFYLPLPQAEGFRRSVLSLLDVALEAPTTRLPLGVVGSSMSRFASFVATVLFIASSTAQVFRLSATENGQKLNTAGTVGAGGRSCTLA